MAKVGILALQGDVAEHARMLVDLGARPRAVKQPGDLEGVDALIIPGGESSTITRLIDIAGLREPLIELIDSGLPTLGTCAGLVLLARTVQNPAPGQVPFGLLPIEVRRNAFGPQSDSAELVAEWRWSGRASTLRAAAIRAPEVVAADDGVEVIARATIQGRSRTLGVRWRHLIGLSLHPELTGDPTVHRALLELVEADTVAAAGATLAQ